MIALVVGIGVWAVVGWMLPSIEAAIDCSVREVATFEEASPIASHCDVDVEVVSERTPWHSSWATSEGLSRLDMSAMPSQVQVDGDWVDLDPTILPPSSAASQPSASGAGSLMSLASMSTSSLPEPDTMLEVAAPVFPIELNPGGLMGRGEPLGTIFKGGHEFSLWFPVALPEPTIDGSQVVYDLGEGVRLFVTINIDATGFIPVIELASPESAEHLADLVANAPGDSPAAEGLLLEFPTEASEGLTYREEANSIELLDDSEEVQFVASAPSMWDSSAGSTVEGENGDIVAIDRSSSAADGDKVAPIDLNLSGTSFVLTPDAAMMSSVETVWPVYVDPWISGKSAAEWVAVRSGGYNNTLYKWGDMTSGPGQGTGYCSTVGSCNVQFYQRLSWEFTGLSILPSLATSDIVSAYMRVNGVHSAYCTAQTTTLRRSSDVSSGNTFSGLTWHESAGSRTEYHRSTCSPTNMGWRNFDAKALVQWGVTNDQTALRMGLRVNEASVTYWKRFRHDATLTIEYNRAPLTPFDHAFDSPAIAGCATTEPALTIASATPTVSAALLDPDGGNVHSHVVVRSIDSQVDVWSSGQLAAVASGQRVQAQVPVALNEDELYAWTVQAFDGKRYSSWSSWCLFRVDTEAPPPPLVTPVTEGVDAIYEEGLERGGIGLAGAFLLDRGANSDAVEFIYSIAGVSIPPVPVGQGGTTAIAFTPTESGDVTLTVRSRDAAGNDSLPTDYLIRVATPLEDVVWTLDEGDGVTAADSFGDPGHPLTIDGATWGEGPHSLFQSRDGDFSLVFDGVNDSATSESPVVDTTESFVVSAHVLLDSAQVGEGPATILSQDGVNRSGFELEYLETCAGMPDGCWAFVMADAPTGAPQTMVTSNKPIRAGEWTHLVAEYFEGNAESPAAMSLWTCDIGTPEQPLPATPDKSSVLRTATPWNAGGALAVGRGLASGAPTNWWHGQIDNIRVFTGEVVDEAKIRRLCQGAEATDFTVGEIALDPTIEGE
ncbi:hypothetical protein [Microcella sp.]|uniref:hypothetical protein n=1 Tax=Microcella sp. TaxID=1913979 RepID=UPI00255E8483|nr:hypothetical protein [Microcella sp.]MBX9472843.1 LamG domain-containing protein [Microcella sp.]